eukprot:gnl/TRDRNA2_/TRDRNA2_30196_c0_seq2.p1 gnl/TRDRNA2_/TRDRNA2_30196_c0~~gnl/TRDRNA2_/TRDRNA2_30196_c0_seq2.p1  ORF type:complete len:392 (+),score=99.59 gnl/TRDRNA2_/TRDRNA2_30196_c0_seq2:71-1246(+)
MAVSGTVEASSNIDASRANTSAHKHTVAELEQMLRNFRLRRRLGLLPGSQSVANEAELRWVRSACRPWRLGEGLAAGEGLLLPGTSDVDPATSRAAELADEASELLVRIERGFQELNAERRSQGGIAEALRRQGESVSTIRSENSSLTSQLEKLQRENQERAAENGKLAARLGLRREERAMAMTQEAVLASAVARLRGQQAATEQVAPAAAASDIAHLREALSDCRAQIRNLIEENAAYERRLHPPESQPEPVPIVGQSMWTLQGDTAAAAASPQDPQAAAAAERQAAVRRAEELQIAAQRQSGMPTLNQQHSSNPASSKAWLAEYMAQSAAAERDAQQQAQQPQPQPQPQPHLQVQAQAQQQQQLPTDAQPELQPQSQLSASAAGAPSAM